MQVPNVFHGPYFAPVGEKPDQTLSLTHLLHFEKIAQGQTLGINNRKFTWWCTSVTYAGLSGWLLQGQSNGLLALQTCLGVASFTALVAFSMSTQRLLLPFTPLQF